MASIRSVISKLAMAPHSRAVIDEGLKHLEKKNSSTQSG